MKNPQNLPAVRENVKKCVKRVGPGGTRPPDAPLKESTAQEHHPDPPEPSRR